MEEKKIRDELLQQLTALGDGIGDTCHDDCITYFDALKAFFAVKEANCDDSRKYLYSLETQPNFGDDGLYVSVTTFDRKAYMSDEPMREFHLGIDSSSSRAHFLKMMAAVKNDKVTHFPSIVRPQSVPAEDWEYEIYAEKMRDISEETVTAIRKTRNLRDERFYDDYFFEEDLNNDPVRD